MNDSPGITFDSLPKTQLKASSGTKLAPPLGQRSANGLLPANCRRSSDALAGSGAPDVTGVEKRSTMEAVLEAEEAGAARVGEARNGLVEAPTGDDSLA